MNRTSRIPLSDLNAHLTCMLCSGYYIDAVTIIECLHSFCRTCLVKYLTTSNFCPVCDVMIHKTKPLCNIRSDKTLQNLVYKLVPGLYKSEMKRRREYYKVQNTTAAMTNGDMCSEGNTDAQYLFPRSKVTKYKHYRPLNNTGTEKPPTPSEARGDETPECVKDTATEKPPTPSEARGDETPERINDTATEKPPTPSEARGDETPERINGEMVEDAAISLSLQLGTSQMKSIDTSKTEHPIRYLQCPPAFTIAHLRKFIRLKYDLPSCFHIDVYHSEDSLDKEYTLLDVAYIYAWKRRKPLSLHYTICEKPPRNRLSTSSRSSSITSSDTIASRDDVVMGTVNKSAEKPADSKKDQQNRTDDSKTENSTVENQNDKADNKSNKNTNNKNTSNKNTKPVQKAGGKAGPGRPRKNLTDTQPQKQNGVKRKVETPNKKGPVPKKPLTTTPVSKSRSRTLLRSSSSNRLTPNKVTSVRKAPVKRKVSVSDTPSKTKQQKQTPVKGKVKSENAKNDNSKNDNSKNDNSKNEEKTKVDKAKNDKSKGDSKSKDEKASNDSKSKPDTTTQRKKATAKTRDKTDDKKSIADKKDSDSEKDDKGNAQKDITMLSRDDKNKNGKQGNVVESMTVDNLEMNKLNVDTPNKNNVDTSSKNANLSNNVSNKTMAENNKNTVNKNDVANTNTTDSQISPSIKPSNKLPVYISKSSHANLPNTTKSNSLLSPNKSNSLPITTKSNQLPVSKALVSKASLPISSKSNLPTSRSATLPNTSKYPILSPSTKSNILPKSNMIPLKSNAQIKSTTLPLKSNILALKSSIIHAATLNPTSTTCTVTSTNIPKPKVIVVTSKQQQTDLSDTDDSTDSEDLVMDLKE